MPASEKEKSEKQAHRLEPVDYQNGKLEEILGSSTSTASLQPFRKKDLGMLAIIAIAFNICSCWAAVSGTMVISVASGGPVTMLFGMIVIFVLSGSCALTMAEIASVYPTAGGQYHWTSILAPKSLSKSLSYVCGVTNVFAWVCTVTGIIMVTPQYVTSLAAFYNPDYASHPWHLFLEAVALNLLFTTYNIFLVRQTPWIHDVGFAISVASFVIIMVTCLARSPAIQNPRPVWTVFLNETGWSSSGIAFLTGLLSPNFMYAGLDGAIHLAEECSNAAVAVPRALISTIIIGFVTSFAFIVSMIYSYTDFDAVPASSSPIMEIWFQASGSRSATAAFAIIIVFLGVFAVIGCLQTASRLTWAFAQDNGFVGSHWIAQIHPTLGVPANALLVNSAIITIMICLTLASSVALNALVATGVILQQLSFAFPAALLLWQRMRGGDELEGVLPSNRPFKLRWGFGWVVNVLTVIHAVLAMAMYNLPSMLPVTPQNMNYSSVIIGAVGIFSSLNWFFFAKGRYNGPRFD